MDNLENRATLKLLILIMIKKDFLKNKNAIAKIAVTKNQKLPQNFS